MKFRLLVVILSCATLPGVSFARQGTKEKPPVRKRVVVTDPYPEKDAVAKPTPPAKEPSLKPEEKSSVAPEKDGEIKPGTAARRASLRFGDFVSRIRQAKRRMQVKPLRISLNAESQTTDIVRLAFFDNPRNELDYVVLSKEEFLQKGYESLRRSEGGRMIRMRTIRGNGVNTPVMIFDSRNRPLIPLLVQYPIERKGKFIEMAYYISSHPAIVTPETVGAGRIYVRGVLNAAREKLRRKGLRIQPSVVDIAERLALVEHVDHYRFRTEPHEVIYNDVYMLYAFNGGQTYRYSVSRAGAGGMVQMIPSTYRMIRSRYYIARLIPDFVRGMRDHQNAAQAMLLYMQMTWNDLAANATVKNALAEGLATQQELMAAGYNSNPARLPGYIKRGGDEWKSLIPRETRIYLQIYSSVEKNVRFVNRSR